MPIFVPLNSRLYLYVFLANEVVTAFLYTLVVLELYSKVLADFTGLASVARRYIQITLAVAVGIALLLLGLVRPRTTLSGYIFSFERTVLSGLIISVLLAGLFLLYYPIPLGRNVVVYLMGFSLFFLTKASLALIVNFGYPWHRQFGSIDLTVIVLCFAFWIIGLTREGELKRVVVGHPWDRADQQRLRSQLDAINASLLRASGKW